jgi:hypothetical protein
MKIAVNTHFMQIECVFNLNYGKIIIFYALVVAVLFVCPSKVFFFILRTHEVYIALKWKNVTLKLLGHQSYPRCC